RYLLVLLLALLGASMMTAQEATEVPETDIPLAPLSNETYRVEGVVPQGWPEIAPGIYARSSGPGDETWVVIQSAVAPVELALQALGQQLRLTEPLEAAG